VFGLTLGLCASATKHSELSKMALKGVGVRGSAVRGRLGSVARRDAQVATSAAAGGVVYTSHPPPMLRVVSPTGC
jgi:hypothetical protein